MAKWVIVAKVYPAHVYTENLDFASDVPYLATRDAGPEIGFKLTSTDRGNRDDHLSQHLGRSGQFAGHYYNRHK